nr:sensor histidine kinase [Streptomyces sp. SID5468]
MCSLRPLRCAAYVLTGAVCGPVLMSALAVLTVAGVVTAPLGVGLVALLAVALSGVAVGAVERRRLRLVEPGRPASPHRAPVGADPLRWVRLRLTERATWRELGYVALWCTVFTGTGVVFAALLGLSCLLAAAPVVAAAIAPDHLMIPAGHLVPGPARALPAAVVGLAGLVVCAWLAALLAGAQAKAAGALLGPRDDDLGARVIELTRSRARMALGQREREAGALIARARGEARDALDLLRDLVRGVHPQVLTDHGLVAAVEELAARHPVPVAVTVDLPHRLPPAVEATAYFTVAEALTSAAKHSGAGRIEVSGGFDGTRLALLVHDDGRGGADPSAGAGLQGLADRLAILGGTLVVSSPAGGPTRLRVEVPC